MVSITKIVIVMRKIVYIFLLLVGSALVRDLVLDLTLESIPTDTLVPSLLDFSSSTSNGIIFTIKDITRLQEAIKMHARC